jgi:hypothetical protein
MTWVVEHLHRDGAVQARVTLDESSDPARVVRLGRALDNDLILDDPHCAAHHAEFAVDASGHAHLIDLGSRNGILGARNERAAVHAVTTDRPFRLGHSLIRMRSSAWPVAPERSLSRRAIWPIALAALALVLLHGAWKIWLRDVENQPPAYLYDLSAQAALLGVWSAIYALFGRLLSGADRFFSHLLIASTGFLAGTMILSTLEVLAFSMSWLWPVRITQPVVVLVAALTVRMHLRLADPRHWPTLRYAVAFVATVSIIVPPLQHWISHRRLTDVQTLQTDLHPALRLAAPVPPAEYSERTAALKAQVDGARKQNTDDESDRYYLGAELDE